jgi:two-component sensor histidine kinase
VGSMMVIYDRLYRQGSYQQIASKAFIELLLNELVQSTQPPDGRMTLEYAIDDLALDTRISFPLGLLINECVTNAYKYAFPAGRKGKIEVTLRAEGAALVLCVADDGVGLPPKVDLEHPASFGLNLVRMMVGQLDAQMTVKREQGTQFWFRIPL